MAPSEFNSSFNALRNELHSYLYRLVAHKENTEDLVQETYIKASQGIDNFKGEASLKTWVFAIATNLAKDFLKSKKRWSESYQDSCRTATLTSKQIQGEMFDIVQNSPQGRFVLKEHVDYCFTCMSKTLSLEEQVCFSLKEVYSFKVNEIMRITQLSEGKVKHALANARLRYHSIFDKRCSLINKTGACYQCTELNGMFNPKQNAEMEANKLRMAKEKDKLNYEQLLDLRLELVKGIDPLSADGFDFHNYMLEHLPEHSGD